MFDFSPHEHVDVGGRATQAFVKRENVNRDIINAVVFHHTLAEIPVLSFGFLDILLLRCFTYGRPALMRRSTSSIHGVVAALGRDDDIY